MNYREKLQTTKLPTDQSSNAQYQTFLAIFFFGCVMQF